MSDESVEVESWWSSLENGAGGDADDARHWVRVYDELIVALERMRPDLAADAAGSGRVRQRLTEARRRRMHWLARVR